MSEFNLGNIEFYLGLVATGKTVTIDNTGSPIAKTDTDIPVTGADLADLKKGDKRFLLKPVDLDEYLYVESESLGTLTVRRDRLKQGAIEIPDTTVLEEYEFVKRKVAPDGVNINSEALINPVRVESHDGAEEILFDTESEEQKVQVTLLSKNDWAYIQEQCPIVTTIEDGTDEKVVYTHSVDDYDATEHIIPAMLAFKNLSYNSWHRIFPKLTLLTLPTENYSKGEVFTMEIELGALKQEITKSNGETEKVYSWSVEEKA